MEEMMNDARGLEDENKPKPAHGLEVGSGSNSAQGLGDENGPQPAGGLKNFKRRQHSRGLEDAEWIDELRKKQSSYIGEAIDKIKTGKIGNITSVKWPAPRNRCKKHTLLKIQNQES